MKLSTLTHAALLLLLSCDAPAPAQESAPAAPLYVAVGYGGRRVSSPDGVNWENDQRWSDVVADDDNVLFNVAYGLDRFIAVGGGAKTGHLVSTQDGKEWKELGPVKGRVATIAFGKGRFVAGHDADLLWSTDGTRFETGEKLGFKGSVHARRSAFGDGEGGAMFVVIGDVDLYAEKKRVGWRASTGDGEHWNSQAAETPDARDVAYGSGHFVVVGPKGLIESSHDGQNWTRHNVDSADDFSRVIWTGKRFLVSGGKVAWSSPDGMSWVPQAKGIPCSLAWGNEGGTPAGIGLSWGGNLWTSPDLVIWKKAALPAGPSLESVACRIQVPR